MPIEKTSISRNYPPNPEHAIITPPYRVIPLVVALVAALVQLPVMAGPARAQAAPVGADIQIDIIAPEAVGQGETIAYQITLTNRGPDPMTGRVEFEGIPGRQGTAYLGSTSPGSCTTTEVNSEPVGKVRTFNCRYDSGLIKNQSVTFTVFIGAPVMDGTLVTSVAILPSRSTNNTRRTADPIPANDVDTATTKVGQAVSDLAVTLSDSPDPVVINEESTYTTTVTNNGPDISTTGSISLEFVDDRSARSLKRITVRRNQDTTSTAADCTGIGSGHRCVLGSLSSGDSATFEFVYTFSKTQAVFALAYVLAGNIAFCNTCINRDPVQANNYDVESTVVVVDLDAPVQADLSVAVEDEPDLIHSYEMLTYKLSVSNQDDPGEDEAVAENVEVTDLLPHGVVFKSASQGCIFDSNSRVVTCQLNTLGVGETASWNIKVEPEGPGTYSNNAVVISNTPDPDYSDNHVSSSTEVLPAADIGSLSHFVPSSTRVGEEVSYTVAVNNQGPDAAEAVTLTSTLPADLAYRSSSVGCSFEATSSTVTCSLGTRPAGETREVSINVVALKPGPVTATASLASSTFDPDESDNDTSATLNAGCVPLPLPGADQIAYPAGWSLIGLPEGTRVSAESKLYGWFDRNDDGDYSTLEPNDAVTAGRGYWVYFGCPRLVSVGTGTTSMTFPLGAYKASMIGNPSGTGPVTVSGHGFAAQWDPSLGSGAGGYHYSGYQEPIALAPGEGAWVFSYEDTEIRITG